MPAERSRLTVRADHAGRFRDLCAEFGLSRDRLFEAMLTSAEEAAAYAEDDDSWLPPRPIVDTPPL